MSDEKVALLRSYGAEVVVCPTAVPPEDPRSYYSTAERLVRETPGAFRPDQYSNPANPLAHEQTTGPEIWRQTDGRSRTSSPASAPAARSPASRAYLKAQNPNVQIVGADPSGSVYSGGTGRPYLVEGVGEDFWPTTFDPSLVDRVDRGQRRRLVPHRAPRDAAKRACSSAARAAPRCTPRSRSRASSGPDDVVVVLLPDSGRSYLSKIFDDEWMFDMGFLRAEGTGRRRRARGEGRRPARPRARSMPDEPARDAITLMHDTGVSQLVVSVTKELPLAAKEVVGTRARARADGPASTATTACSTARSATSCSAPMPMIGIGEPVARVVELLDQEPSVLVLDGGHPIGVLTRSDVLSFLAARAAMSLRDATDRLRDARHPRRARSPTRRPARSCRRSPRDDVRAGGGRQAPGLRVRAQRQPDAQRARDVPRVARRRGPRPRVRERARGRGRDAPHALDPATT